MKSIREIYKIGFGPSSSHTMGPERACRMLLARFPEAVSYSVTLLGSLAMTGEGHGTDRVIRKTMLPLFGEVIFDRVSPTPKHPNTMDISLFGKYICPTLNITNRFVGEEPFDNVTRQYNNAMRKQLGNYGINFVEIPRKALLDGEIISATKVRSIIINSNNDIINYTSEKTSVNQC